MKKKWIIGTRGSKLALIQTDIVRDGLSRLYPEMEFTIKVIKTTGDSIWDTPLYLIGSKGLFIKEIEEELVAGGIDLAVHSVKDFPTELSDGLCLSAVLKREDPRDAFISLKYDTPLGVRQGARIGTSSMRRKAQIAALRPDIEVVPLRGNVDTRVRKLEAGDLDAVILACAGVMRMGLRESIKEAIPLDVMVPPCGQGAIGIEARSATEAEEYGAPSRPRRDRVRGGPGAEAAPGHRWRVQRAPWRQRSAFRKPGRGARRLRRRRRDHTVQGRDAGRPCRRPDDSGQAGVGAGARQGEGHALNILSGRSGKSGPHAVFALPFAPQFFL